MVCEEEPNRIYFARNGAPLIIAKSINEEAEAFISSDILGAVAISKNYYHLKDKEWGYFDSKGYSLFDWERNPQQIYFS